MARTLTVIFTLFGAYIQPRGGEVWAGSLVRLLEPFGMSETAVRLALSRMSRQGLIRSRKVGRRSLYALTEKGQRWMHAGRRRGLEREPRAWDSRWRLLTYNIPERARHLRDALRQELRRLGYGNLSNALWISPYDLGADLERVLQRLKARGYVETFEANYPADARRLVTRAWDVAGLGRRYRAFLRKYLPALARHRRRLGSVKPPDPAECFAQRFRLTAEFIDIAMDDPMPPPALLPSDWPGTKARTVFAEYRELLAVEADRFVDAALEPAPRSQGPKSRRALTFQNPKAGRRIP